MKTRITTFLASALLAISAILLAPSSAQAATDYKSWSCSYDSSTFIKVTAWDNSNGTRTYHFYVREKTTSPTTQMKYLRMRSNSGYTWRQYDLRGVTGKWEKFYTKPNQYHSRIHMSWTTVRNGVMATLTCPKPGSSDGTIGHLM